MSTGHEDAIRFIMTGYPALSKRLIDILLMTASDPSDQSVELHVEMLWAITNMTSLKDTE